MNKKLKTKLLSIDELLHEGLLVLQGEITKLRNGQTDQLLDPRAAEILNKHLGTLLAIKREERQAAVAEDLEKIDDNILQTLAKEASQFVLKSGKWTSYLLFLDHLLQKI